MGRKNKYETHVKPFLNDIPKWYEDMTEYQIARKLGIAPSTFELYKIKYPELVECLRTGKKMLADELKESLRRKAKGFYYTETKTIDTSDGEHRVETTKKYAAPDTGAIHLLLKNIDDDWRNDDKATMDLKREKFELEKQKSEESW